MEVEHPFGVGQHRGADQFFETRALVESVGAGFRPRSQAAPVFLDGGQAIAAQHSVEAPLEVV